MTEHGEKRRVLLMYISKVSGHRQATVAIQQALRQLDPHLEAPAINGFGYTYPRMEKLINKAYMGVIKRTPQIWDYLYDNPKIVKGSQSIKEFIHKSSHDKIAKLFERHRPDAVVCTQAFPCGMVADYKRTCGFKTVLIAVLTDFFPHAFWINEGVDYYVVPCDEAKERLIEKGVPEAAIKVYGIPLRSKFALRLDKTAIAKQMGLDPNVPTILIMGGGQGLGPIKSIVKTLSKIERNMQMIVLAGVNTKIIHSVKKYIHKRKILKKILILGYSTNVDELMEVSDLIITKPGGMTTSEALAKGLPIVIVNPIPGQEMRNTDFLIRKGIGIRIDDTDDVGEEVDLLLKFPERLAAMRQAAYENAKPYAALDIARLILAQIGPPPAANPEYNLESQNYRSIQKICNIATEKDAV